MRALFGLAAVVVLAQVVFYFCRTVDDMFISLRYAERLVSGQGLTFNDGEWVEGFSNPLWVFLQAALLGLGVDGVVGTKLLSLASYGLLFWGVWRYGRRVLGLRVPFAAGALLLLGCSSYVASWALWGLETPLYLALLVWLLLALRERLRAPTRRNLLALAGVAVALLATRPEAPLYVAAVGLALLVRGDGGAPSRRLRRLLAPGLTAAGLVALLLLWRYVVYDQWLPQTYYAKQAEGFDLARLAPLVSQGASPFEVVYLLGAIALAAWLAVRARVPELVAVALTTLFFVASVSVDWMPNQRHFLPLVVLAPLPWLWLAQAAFDRAGSWSLPARLQAVVFAAVLGLSAGYGYASVSVDARFSRYDFPSHGGGERWVRPKTAQTWRDALDGLARRAPRHIEAMSLDRMGMIDQLFRILEASAEPESRSWFIGRDIGRVGYYSPIQIYDTAGLFTPELTASPAWRRDGTVDDDVVRAAFAREPVATDLLDGWPVAVARHRDLLDRHEILIGSRGRPYALRPVGLERPSPAEVLARYERVVDKLRAPFYQATLYGESVGAAVEKRARWLRPRLLAQGDVLVSEVPAGLEPSAPIDLDRGRVRLHGCRLEAAPEPAPGRVVLACYFERRHDGPGARAIRAWEVFVHLVDDQGRLRHHGDHPPALGLYPTPRWEPGRIVRDTVLLDLPPELREVTLSTRVGLWAGAARADARRPVDGSDAPGGGIDAAPDAPDAIEDAIDGDGRVIGPVLRRIP